MAQHSPQRAPSAGIHLVAGQQRAYSPLALWHLLSLDAPTVAALWTCFVARTEHIRLPWTSPAAMFLATWMLYAADRLLDARPDASGKMPPHLEARHHFHRNHRIAFRRVFAAASIALALLLHTLPAAALHLYILAAALLAGYLMLVHIAPLPDAHRLPKELAVGIFFPAATFIPTVSRDPALRTPLLLPAALFAAVCTLNCLFLYAWEHPHNRANAHATTRWATAHLRAISIALTAACIAAAALQPATSIAIACAVSTTLLLLLDAVRTHFRAVHQRALADAALLTPALLLPFLR